MATGPDRGRSPHETEARDKLMREQFERDKDSWEKAVLTEKFSDDLDAIIEAKKKAERRGGHYEPSA